MKVKQNRSLILYIIFTALTCGIYGLYFFHALARDVNVICDDDGKHTRGLLGFIFFSIITLGIYQIVWWYSIGTRLKENAPRYGLEFKTGGGAVIAWAIFGSLLCGIGPLISFHLVIKHTNQIAEVYNSRRH